jgi:hypothetical protein
MSHPSTGDVATIGGGFLAFAADPAQPVGWLGLTLALAGFASKILENRGMRAEIRALREELREANRRKGDRDGRADE